MSKSQYSIFEYGNISLGGFMDYIDRIIALREDHDLTQAQIAAFLGRSQQGYAHIENRRAKLTIEDMMKLCEFYNECPEYVLGYTAEKMALKKRIKK